MRDVSRQRLRHLNVRVLGVALVVALIDVSSKVWARHALIHAHHVVGPLWLRLQFNPGVSFSLNHGLPLVSALVTMVVAITVVVVGMRARVGLATWGFGLLIGGGVGNVVDRWSSSPPRVTDFISISSFPVFNAADAAISLGFVVLLTAIIRGQQLVGP